MTADEIKRAYDEAVEEVLLAHRTGIAEILEEGQRAKDGEDIEKVRARLIEHLP